MPHFFISNNEPSTSSKKNIKDYLQRGGGYAICYGENPSQSRDYTPLVSIDIVDLKVFPQHSGPRMRINFGTGGHYDLFTHPKNAHPIQINELLKQLDLPESSSVVANIPIQGEPEIFLERPERMDTLLKFLIERIEGSGLHIEPDMLESIKTFFDIHADYALKFELEKLKKQTIDSENKCELEVKTINEQKVLEMGKASFDAGNLNAFSTVGKFLESNGKHEAAVQAYSQTPRNMVSFKMAAYQAGLLCMIKLNNPHRALYYYLQALQSEKDPNSEMGSEIKFHAMRCLSSIFDKNLSDAALELILKNTQVSDCDNKEGYNLNFVSLMTNFTLATLDENQKLKEENARLKEEILGKSKVNIDTSSNAEPILRQFISTTSVVALQPSSTLANANINDVSRHSFNS